MEAVCMLTSCTYTSLLQEEDQRRRNMEPSEPDVSLKTNNGPKQRRSSTKWFLCPQTDGGRADSVLSLLKSCSEHGDLSIGVLLHADVVRKGLFESDPFVGTAIISMYAKCGALRDAQRVFHELPYLNVVAWNAILTAFSQHGYGEKALECFKHMQSSGLLPDSVTFACILNVCGSLGASDMGQEIHAQIVRERILDRNIVVANALINMYAKCGLLENAQEVFDKLPVRSVVSWTTLISGYAKYGYGMEALVCCDEMQDAGFSPNAVTVVCILKACGCIRALEKGQQFHARSVRNGFLETNNLVANALIDMYMKCCVIGKAEQLFYELSSRDIVSWTALISGLTEYGYSSEALQYFDLMVSKGCIPNVVTYGCILKACSSTGALEKGLELHRQILEHNLGDEDNNVIGIALVDMYAKCGALAMAQSVFDQLLSKDVVLWNALISGYTLYGGYHEKVLDMFEHMHLGRVSPDAVTYSCTLKACSALGAALKGQGLHAEIIKFGLLENDLFIGNAISDMYANCCMPVEAQYVFVNLSQKDVASWNSFIAGYAYLGKADVAFEIFERMKGGGIEPNSSTFCVLLSTFSHRGLLNEGQMFLQRMVESYDTMPTPEHLTCLVDLFSRAGCLDIAITMVNWMPFFEDILTYLSFVGGGLPWGSFKVDNWAFEQLGQMKRGVDTGYASMSNVYAAGAGQADKNSLGTFQARRQLWEVVLQLECE